MLMAIRSAAYLSFCTFLLTASGLSQNPPKSGVAVCAVGPAVGRSAPELVQVSNLALIYITCRVRARRLPKSGILHGLGISATAYQVSMGDTRTLVQSGFNLSGGGGDSNFESVNFYV